MRKIISILILFIVSTTCAINGQHCLWKERNSEALEFWLKN